MLKDEKSNPKIMNKEEYNLIIDHLNKKKITLVIKRIFDLILSLIMLIVFSPILIMLSIFVLIDSGNPILFKQDRMGKNGNVFRIIKFRTMVNNTETEDGITKIKDSRITKIGVFLRKYRLDEVPQLINIIRGEMSFVGPRPDIPKYYKVDDYGYKCVLLVKPGVTGEATLRFKDEDKILSLSNNPEKTYNEKIFPEKIKLNIEYIKNISLLYDTKLVFRTIRDVFIR